MEIYRVVSRSSKEVQEVISSVDLHWKKFVSMDRKRSVICGLGWL